MREKYYVVVTVDTRGWGDEGGKRVKEAHRDIHLWNTTEEERNRAHASGGKRHGEGRSVRTGSG